MKKQQIVVIHGGSAFETYEEYLQDLRAREPSMERILRKDWKASLNDALGDNYLVLNPKMPNPDNAKYSEWKIWFEKLISIFDDETIMIGHSLGGIFLVKYLSENDYPKKIKATFLVAAPYNTESQHPLADFNIEKDLSGLIKQGGSIFIYHSRDDEVVPFSNCERYKKELPGATLRIFEDRQHFNQKDFPEIVEDLKLIKI